MDNIIEIKHLKKYFQDVKAVDDISFSVKSGALFAFLGLNGAGKSTTINIICGNLQKDEGQISVNGIDIDSEPKIVKNMLGVVFQDGILDKKLTAKENMECYAALYGIVGNNFKNRIKELDELLHFEDILKRPIEKLSGGQRRKIDIATALLHNPQILILDEPTTGLDPVTRKVIWNAVNKLRKEKNITVFLTTHYMEETAEADDIVILDSGKIVAQGSPLQLKNEYTGDFIKLYGSDEEKVKLLNLPYKTYPDYFKIEVRNSQAVTDSIIKHPEIFTDYEIIKGQMDDVFLAVTGKNLKGDF